MKLLLSVILVLSVLSAKAQCSLVHRTDGIAYQAEEIYRNKNLEDGLLNIYLSFLKDSHGWHIIGTFGTTDVNDASVRPNRLVLNYTGSDNFIGIDATTVSTKQDGRLHVVFSVFDVTQEQINILKTQKISTVMYMNVSQNAGEIINSMDPTLLMRQIAYIEAAR